MAIDAGRGPLHISRVDGDVCYGITVVPVLSLTYKLAGAYIIHICGPVFRARQQIAIAVGHLEADVEVSVLVVTGVFSDSLASPQVPKLDCVICTACQESIESV